jgi:hypothetical protein
MGLGFLFVGFLQRIAVGALTVLVLLLFIRLGMPRRSVISARGRKIDELPQP